MQTRDERIEELKKSEREYELSLKQQVIDLLQPFVDRKVGVALHRHSYNKEVYMDVYIIDEETKEKVFASGIDVYFEKRIRFTKNNNFKETNDSYMMGVNYGSCGTHTRIDYDGALKASDILIGKIWEKEEELTKIYNSIEWNDLEELENLIDQVRKEKIEAENKVLEEQRRQEKIKLDTVLDFCYEGKRINHPTDKWRSIYISKVGRKNITLACKIFVNHKYTDYVNKYDFARYLLAQGYKYMED